MLRKNRPHSTDVVRVSSKGHFSKKQFRDGNAASILTKSVNNLRTSKDKLYTRQNSRENLRKSSVNIPFSRANTTIPTVTSTSMPGKLASSSRQSTSKSHLQVTTPLLIEEEAEAEAKQEVEQLADQLDEERRKRSRGNHTRSSCGRGLSERIHSDDDGEGSSLSDSDVDSEIGQLTHKVTRGISDLESDIDDFGDETDLECDDKQYLLDANPPYDPTGVDDYYRECDRLGKIPAAYLKRNIKESNFTMKHYGLGPVGTKAMTKTFQVNTTIEKLDFEGNGVGDTGSRYLASMLKDNLYVNELVLSNNNIGSVGVKALCDMLQENCNISTFELSGNAIRDSDGVHFGNMLQVNSTVTKLILRHNNFEERTAKSFHAALTNNEFIRMLDLGWNHLRAEAAVHIGNMIKDNYGLKYLNLCMNGLADHGCKLLSEGLKVNRCLVDVNISNNRITSEGASYLAKALEVNEVLETIRVGHNPIGADGALKIMQAIHTNNANTSLTLFDANHVVVGDAFETEKNLINEERKESTKLHVVHGGVLFRGKHLIFIDEDEAGNEFENDPMTKLHRYAEKTKYRMIDVFKQLDTDNSWSLSKAELSMASKKLKGLELTDEDCDKFISRLDKDGDGEVDFAELIAGDDEFRLQLRNRRRTFCQEAGSDEDRMISLALGERDEFTTQDDDYDDA